MAERNYAKEAAAILAGQSRLIPELEHLQAMNAQMAAVQSNLRLVLEILAALMHDAGSDALDIPKGLHEASLARRSHLLIHRDSRTGDIHVERKQPDNVPAPNVPAPSRVM